MFKRLQLSVQLRHKKINSTTMGSSSSKPADIAKQKTKEAEQTLQAARRAQGVANSQLNPEKIKECQKQIEGFLDDELKAMKDEVHAVDEIIPDKDGITIKSLEDVVLLQYEKLQNPETVKQNVRKVCQGFPALELLIDAAATMIEAVQTTSELKKLFRWQQRQTTRLVPDDDGTLKVVGLELHYKVKVIEEKQVAGAMRKAWDWFKGEESDKTTTIVMVAYKILAKNLVNANPENFVDDSDLSALTF